MRCPDCHGKNGEAQRTDTIEWGEPRTLSHCAPWARAFSATRHPPLAQLKTPIALVVQGLAALTAGGGINAATRLYGVSNHSISRWQERRSGVKKLCGCVLCPISFSFRGLKVMSCIHASTSIWLQMRLKDERAS